MSDSSHSCEHSASATCPLATSEGGCPGDGACQTRVTLRDARDQFERDAVWSEVDTGRYRCRYFCWGRGPTLLFMPGLAEAAESFILVCCRLASSFRCVAYELPGRRGDGADLRRYTHAQLVSDAFALLDRIGASQCYAFGSSFGSTIALGALHANPDRVLRGVLVGGFARRPLTTAERWLANAARFLPGTMGQLPWRRGLLRRAHGEAFAECPPENWEYFLQRSGAPTIASVANRARLVHQVDLRPLLSQIRQPVLLITGDSDPLVSKACADELLHGLPNNVRVEFEHCGHFPQYTHPELLADVVRGFLMPSACSAKPNP